MKTKRNKLVEKLVDAAFGQLAWDCDPSDIGSIRQRAALKARFEKIMGVRHVENRRLGKPKTEKKPTVVWHGD